MVIVEKEIFSQVEVKKSLFISHLVPTNEFEQRLNDLRETHKKANHHVWAFRRLNDNGQIEEGASDDGEPSGTSGPPTLRILQGNELINCAIITIRYFGGTKLGTGGLVRAYGESAKSVIKDACFKPYKKLQTTEISIIFKKIPHVEYLCEQKNVQIIKRKFNEAGAIITLEGVEKDLEKICAAIVLR
ncbi:IMPACT family protein [Kiloniella antarctica]|uniref:IMPACT family protein n=1 Tax=Kiloniella antarctica TaxID=1550907 RepID=A0ABW5BN54_9PROT